MEKISFQVNKDIADHPHFHNRFLKLVAEFEDSKDIFCVNCKHSKFDHVIGKHGVSYCRICYEKNKKDKTFKDCERFTIKERKR